jgi:HAE1 family hydrophobic/amphiphilic exporter-1
MKLQLEKILVGAKVKTVPGGSWTAEDAPIALIVTGTSFAMVLQKLRKN